MSISRVHDVEATHAASASFSSRYLGSDAPANKYALSENPMTAAGAAQLIKDECLLDGNPTMNLASFVTTYMEDETMDIVRLSQNKNIADQEQYPASNEIQERCVNILAQLYNSPSKGPARGDPTLARAQAEAEGKDGDKAAADAVKPNERCSVGTSTIGSSEAIMLGGLAMKWRWRQWRAKRALEAKKSAAESNKKSGEASTGIPDDAAKEGGMLKGEGWATSAVLANRSYGPGSGEPACNLIMSASMHVSMLKTCKYLDIEPRIIPLAHGRYTLDPDLVMENVDENTIGVMLILGNTLTGAFDPVEEINDRLIAYNKQHGTDIGIHVDGASGAFCVPFSHPEFKFDFRLDRVKSINVSGHKFGMVYPGLGWIVWKEKADLPEDLIFHINYLGADEPTYGLNFSKPAANVLLQYFVFLRLGRTGFERIIRNCLSNAKHIAQQLLATGIVEIISENLSEKGETIPVCVWRLKPDERTRRLLGFDERELVHELRTRGWIMPAYGLPANCSDMVLIRIVVRESLSHETCDLLLHDIRSKMVELIQKNAERFKQMKKLLRMQANGKIGPASKASPEIENPAVTKAVAALTPAQGGGSSSDDEDEEAKDPEDIADEHARSQLIADILGSAHASRPHARLPSVHPTGAAGSSIGAAVQKGLASAAAAVGLKSDDHENAPRSQSHAKKKKKRFGLMETITGRASHTHTGAAGSAEAKGSNHITSVIC